MSLSTWKRAAVATLASSMAALSLVGCTDSGKADDDGGGKVTATTVDALYTAAKKEGTVVWHVGFAEDEASVLQEGFEKAYPGVEVNIVAADTDTIPPKLISEAQADKVSLDVATGRTDGVEPLVDRDLIEDIDWKSFSPDIEDRQLELDGKMVKMYDFINGWAYNADLLDEADVPHSWDELASDKYAGKIIGDAGGDLGIGALVNSGEWTEDQAHEFIDKIAALKPDLASDGNVSSASVGQGEYALGAIPLTVVPRMQDEGANIQVLPVGPLSSVSTSMFVPKGAPHPNAARLLVLWLASPDGTKVWQSLGRGLTDTCEASKLGQLLCDAGVQAIPLTDFDQVDVERQLADYGVKAFAGLPTVGE